MEAFLFIGKDYIIEAFKFHLLSADQRATIKSIRTTPRKALNQKVNNVFTFSCQSFSFLYFLIQFK